MKSITIGFSRIILLYSVGVLYACFVVFGTFAEAQQGKFYRVGVLVVGGADIPQIKGLREGLKNYGYIQGKNLDLEISAKETRMNIVPLLKATKTKMLTCLSP